MSRLPRSCRCGGFHYKGERCPAIGEPLAYKVGWNKTRARIIARDGGICYLCGGFGANSVDHIVARANGGSEDDSNLRAAHVSCNAKKGVKNYG